MMNLHESIGPGQDQTRDPWICSQTHMYICSQTCYWLPYAAQRRLYCGSKTLKIVTEKSRLAGFLNSLHAG